MFSKISVLFFLFILHASTVFNLDLNQDFLLQEAITNLRDKNTLLRNEVTKFEECDLEGNITEIMNILEAQSQV